MESEPSDRGLISKGLARTYIIGNFLSLFFSHCKKKRQLDANHWKFFFPCYSAFSCFALTDLVETLFHQAGFETLVNDYAHRRTVNKKEGVDVPRIFVQAKFRKPEKPEWGISLTLNEVFLSHWKILKWAVLTSCGQCEENCIEIVERVYRWLVKLIMGALLTMDYYHREPTGNPQGTHREPTGNPQG